jgi:hypothetical protein
VRATAWWWKELISGAPSPTQPARRLSGSTSSSCEFDPVDHVRARVGVLGGHVLREGAAVGDGEHLAAAADAEDRHALLERRLGDADLERVVLGRDRVDGGVALLAVVARIDVLAARQDHAVQVLEQLVDVAGRGVTGQGDHERARGGERLAEVALHGDQQGIGQLERDADLGATGHA